MEAKNIEVGDIVKVIEFGHTYTTYNEWFAENDYNLYQMNYHCGVLPNTQKRYEVVGVGKHQWLSDVIYAIRDFDTHQVYLVGVDGLKLAYKQADEYYALNNMYDDLMFSHQLVAEENINLCGEVHELRAVNSKQRDEILSLRKRVDDLVNGAKYLRREVLDAICSDLLGKEIMEALDWYCDTTGYGVYWVCQGIDEVEITLFDDGGNVFTKKSSELCADVKEAIKAEMDDRMEWNEYDEADYLFNLHKQCSEWWE